MAPAVDTCDDNAGFNKFANDSTPAVFYFYASWDAASKIIAPYVEELAKKDSNIKFVKVDVDVAEDLANGQNVWQFPTFLFYKKGRQHDRYVGSDRSTLANKIKALKA
ncbi:Monodehydroascorbate reductase (NADH) [Bertholletia excelsa]